MSNRKKDLFDPEVLADFIFDMIQRQGVADDWAWFAEHPEYRCFERPFLASDCGCVQQGYDFAMGNTDEVFPVRTILTRINEHQMIRSFELK